MMFTRSRRAPLPRSVTPLIAAPALAFSLIVSPAPQAVAATTTINPVADAYVQSDQAGVNFGTSVELRVDASPTVTSYLKFDVQDHPVPLGKATLRVFTNTTGSTSVKLSSVADSTWTEPDITFDNAPPIGAVLGSSGALTAGTWVAYDVTGAVGGNGLVSFALTTNSTSARKFDSREGANKPELVLEQAPPPSTDPVVVVAGDIACDPADTGFNGGQGTASRCHMTTTSDLILGIAPAAVLELGTPNTTVGSWPPSTSATTPRGVG